MNLKINKETFIQMNASKCSELDRSKEILVCYHVHYQQTQKTRLWMTQQLTPQSKASVTHKTSYSLDLVEQGITGLQVERDDSFDGFLMYQSLGGGTGSGLGSYLAQEIRDEFTKAKIVCHCVLPHDQGEVILQNYNSILSLNYLQRSADSLIITSNNILQNLCKSNQQNNRPSMQDYNNILARDLASIYLPSSTNLQFDLKENHNTSQQLQMANRSTKVRDPLAFDDQDSREGLWGNEAQEGFHETKKLVLDNICSLCQNNLNFLSLRFCPQVSNGLISGSEGQVSSISNSINRMFKNGSLIEEQRSSLLGYGVKNESLGSILISRGLQQNEIQKLNTVLPLQLFYDNNKLIARNSKLALEGIPKSMSLISNDKTLVGPISTFVDRAQSMYQAKAYIHHYEKYGYGKDDLENSIISIQNILDDYTKLSKPNETIKEKRSFVF